MKLWWNGTIIDEQEAVIPLADHGFLYGMGLFETFRTYGGRPFLLDQHMERMAEGLEELRIHYVPDRSEVCRAIEQLLQANGLEDAYIRWSVSAGPSPHGLPASTGYDRPNAVITAKAVPARHDTKELHLLQLARSTPEGGTVRRKSFHYMNNILARWELAERTGAGNAEGLFTDAEGVIVEGIVSNVFWVKGDTLFTPSVDTGCLPGVTRQAVLDLAKTLDIPVQEGRFLWEELLDAEEVFVTNSIQELTPAVRFYDQNGALRKSWDEGAGKMVVALHQAYQRLRMGERG